jgi:hypothetical protein
VTSPGKTAPGLSPGRLIAADFSCQDKHAVLALTDTQAFGDGLLGQISGFV